LWALKVYPSNSFFPEQQRLLKNKRQDGVRSIF
jgi:hypothetical protein